VNRTHDPELSSWVVSAQGPTDFPIQNLPFGVFRRRESRDAPAVGIAIGDQILDVSSGAAAGVFTGAARTAAEACAEPSLNRLMELGTRSGTALREQVSAFLSTDSASYRKDPTLADRCLVPMAEAELFLPAHIGDYSDFYASVHHATNVGSMFRPDNPLLPNYKWIPIGYHGRASSIVLSGTSVRRPRGQLKAPNADRPVYAPSRALDYEAEIGCLVGQGSTLGEPVAIDSADEHLFGLLLVNDWSARDIQSWEYQPLGPFLAKSFATSISPWIVTLEALEPFRVPAFQRPAGDPEPLPHLDSESNRSRGGIDVVVEVYLSSKAMRQSGVPPARISRSRMADLYWTVAQMLAHQTSNGCNLIPGDLFATGTISGATKESRGCLLERTWRGAEPLTLPNGEQRSFLEDGDEVILRGICERPGAARIGFGECRGVIASANARGLSAPEHSRAR
jgi:fumarylacetoacetase